MNTILAPSGKDFKIIVKTFSKWESAEKPFTIITFTVSTYNSIDDFIEITDRITGRTQRFYKNNVEIKVVDADER